MKVYKHRIFHQWAIKEGLQDKKLIAAINEMNEGLYDGNLGSGLYKKRITAEGKGKRGGYRTLLAFKTESKAFFVYGFAKNEKDNVNAKELQVYKLLAKEFLSMSDAAIQRMLNSEKLYEVQDQ